MAWIHLTTTLSAAALEGEEEAMAALTTRHLQESPFERRVSMRLELHIEGRCLGDSRSSNLSFSPPRRAERRSWNQIAKAMKIRFKTTEILSLHCLK